MKSRVLSWAVGIITVAVLVVGIGAVAQDPPQRHLRGLINAYTPVSKVKGPWEIRGEWSLHIEGDSGKADFSADLNMGHSDYWLLTNPNPPANPDDPSTRTPHTHHIIMEDGVVTLTSTGFSISGPVTITANGGTPPFGTSSTLQIDITGGSIITLSNIQLTFGGDAVNHFGSLPLTGVVRASD
ncbi:MAG TPA: hypothetical protein VE077_21245 [Candidatus Methylomirabilis sp.]|nr:hypothetical protein [Candidatus Methylomirabilis sp.]